MATKTKTLHYLTPDEMNSFEDVKPGDEIGQILLYFDVRKYYLVHNNPRNIGSFEIRIGNQTFTESPSHWIALET